MNIIILILKIIKELHQNKKFIEYLESCKEHPDKLKDKQRKSQEFIEVIDRIGGLPGYNHFHKFSDNVDMALWFANQNHIFSKERIEEITPNHKRMTEAKIFAKIYNHLYDMNHIKK